MKYLYYAFLLLLIGCNDNKNETSNDADSSAVLVVKDSVALDSVKVPLDNNGFTGSYTYSTPSAQGYFYYRMDLVQKGKEITGDFFAGNYLVQLPSGDYVQPGATLSGKIDGTAHSNSYATISLPEIKEEDRIDSTYSFPDLNLVFETDAQEDYVILCTRNNNSFYAIVQGDTIVWEKENTVK